MIDETGNHPFDYCHENNNFESIKFIQKEIETFRAVMDYDIFKYSLQIGNESSMFMISKGLFKESCILGNTGNSVRGELISKDTEISF